MMDEEVEVDAVLVFSKKMKLRAANGHHFVAKLEAYESQSPYCIILNILTEFTELRMDVYESDLAKEMGEWLKGKIIHSPATIVPQKIEEAMTLFVKFAQPPPQIDLIMWVLSRSEIQFGPNAAFKFGGLLPNRSIDVQQDQFANEFQGMASAAPQRLQLNASHKSLTFESPLDTHLKRPSSAPARRTSSHSLSSSCDDIRGTLSATKSILGKSIALDELPKAQLKGRASAAPVHDKKGWTDDHHRLVRGLKAERGKIDQSMERRRQLQEMADARLNATKAKYSTIRDRVNGTGAAQRWKHNAADEIENYFRIQADVERDIKRVQAQSKRAEQNARLTIAPNGFVNRRGVHTKGPYMGTGPPPNSAISHLRNPDTERVHKQYYWDSYGRRQVREASSTMGEDEVAEGSSHAPSSAVDKVGCALRPLIHL